MFSPEQWAAMDAEDAAEDAAEEARKGVIAIDMIDEPPFFRITPPKTKPSKKVLPHVGASLDRYLDRLEAFEEDGQPYPVARHSALWVLHNAVAHPLLGLFPGEYTGDFHELTSRWLNKAPRWKNVRLPKIDNRRKWVIHNCLVHPLIGLLPLAFAFDIHDESARHLGVPGWV